MISVNFFAQPSAGKSTSAALAFAYLKNRACNVELVDEFAKKMVYSRRQHEMSNQVYMFGKQYKRMDDIRRYGLVNMILTDSPLLLGLVYSESAPYYKELSDLIYKIHDEFENVNVLVKRTKPYNPSGRNQNEKESDALASKVRALIPKFDYEIDGDEEGQTAFAKTLFERYGSRIQIEKA